MNDSLLVQEVQAARYGQRHVLTLVAPVEHVRAIHRVPHKRFAKITALQGDASESVAVPTTAAGSKPRRSLTWDGMVGSWPHAALQYIPGLATHSLTSDNAVISDG